MSDATTNPIATARRILELAEKATAGPWIWQDKSGSYGGEIYSETDGGRVVATDCDLEPGDQAFILAIRTLSVELAESVVAGEKPDCWRPFAAVRGSMSYGGNLQYTCAFVSIDGIVRNSFAAHPQRIEEFAAIIKELGNPVIILCAADGTPKPIAPPPSGLEVRE